MSVWNNFKIIQADFTKHFKGYLWVIREKIWRDKIAYFFRDMEDFSHKYVAYTPKAFYFLTWKYDHIKKKWQNAYFQMKDTLHNLVKLITSDIWG